jgi:hypothetical protein
MCCCSTCPPKLCYLAFDDLLEKASLRRDSKTIENLDVCVEIGISKTSCDFCMAARVASAEIYKSLSFSPSFSLHNTPSRKLTQNFAPKYLCRLSALFFSKTRAVDLMI